MFTLILLSGCEQPTKVGDEVEIDIAEIEYEGHTYLVFQENRETKQVDYIFRNDLNCFNVKYEYIQGLYK